jgi:hypothetical protein
MTDEYHAEGPLPGGTGNAGIGRGEFCFEDRSQRYWT